MSYCRWSTDDFQCDLYCYGDVRGGWTTHVGNNKVIFKEPLPAPVPFDREHIAEFYERHQRVMKMLDTVDRVPLGLPYDGQTFNSETLEEFLDLLLMLREAGYRFPDCVIETVREEIAEEATGGT